MLVSCVSGSLAGHDSFTGHCFDHCRKVGGRQFSRARHLSPLTRCDDYVLLFHGGFLPMPSSSRKSLAIEPLVSLVCGLEGEAPEPNSHRPQAHLMRMRPGYCPGASPAPTSFGLDTRVKNADEMVGRTRTAATRAGAVDAGSVRQACRSLGGKSVSGRRSSKQVHVLGIDPYVDDLTLLRWVAPTDASDQLLGTSLNGGVPEYIGFRA